MKNQWCHLYPTSSIFEPSTREPAIPDMTSQLLTKNMAASHPVGASMAGSTPLHLPCTKALGHLGGWHRGFRQRVIPDWAIPGSSCWSWRLGVLGSPGSLGAMVTRGGCLPWSAMRCPSRQLWPTILRRHAMPFYNHLPCHDYQPVTCVSQLLTMIYYD